MGVFTNAMAAVMILLVFGMVSIAYMVQMPKGKTTHNIKRVIRGARGRGGGA